MEQPDVAVKKIEILLIEDNRADALLFRSMLHARRENSPYRTVYAVTWAQSFEEGLALARQGGWDIIVSDLYLPDAPVDDVPSMVNLLLDAAGDAPVLLLSGMDDEELTAAAIQQGVQDYLVKGEFRAGLLVRTMNHAIVRKRLERRQAGLAGLELSSNNSQQLQAVLEEICRFTAEELPATGGAALLFWDESAQRLIPAAHYALMPLGERARGFLDQPPAFILEMFTSRTPMVVRDTFNEEKVIQAFVQEAGLRAFIAAPLVHEGVPLGLLFALDRRPRLYRKADQDFLMDLAKRAAAAIARVQLLEQERFERKLAQSLHEVSRALNTTSSLPEVIQQVLLALKQLLSCDDALVLLSPSILPEGSAPQLYPLYKDKLETWLRRDNPLAMLDVCLRRRNVIYYEDLSAFAPPWPLLRTERSRSWLGAPLFHRDRPVGMVILVSDEPRAYGRQEIEAVKALAEQAATAIVNVLLYEQTRSALATTDALFSTAQSLIMPLGLQDVLRTVAESARSALGAEQVSIVRINADEKRVLSYTVSGQEASAGAETINFDEMWRGLTGWAIRNRRSLLASNGHAHPFDGAGRERPGTADASHCTLVAPIIFRGNILGAMTAVNGHRRPAFSENDRRLLEAMANQAAMAIHHAMLFERTREMAHIDALTGLHTRRRFFELGQHILLHAARFQEPLSAIMFDIDHFKSINDAFGHAAGDVVLRQVAKHTQAQLRRTDLLGRYGGEEFAILLPNTDITAAYSIAERLRSAVAEHSGWLDQESISVTISLGLVERQPHVTDLYVLLRDADRALYTAKNRGRNQVAMWPNWGNILATSADQGRRTEVEAPNSP